MIRPRFIVVSAVAVLLTFLAHEGAHWAAGELLGNRMDMNLNAAYPESGQFLKASHKGVVDAAGPLLTLLQAVLALLVVLKAGSLLAYPFILSALVMRLLATGVSVFNPNDEARLSLAMGLGTWTLPFLVCGVLVALTIIASRRLRATWSFNTISVVLIILFSSAVILSSQFVAGR
ncbi:MAG TPA: hypothetical protein VF701_18140 [Thermoanaerobaculia bacterium]